MILSDSTQLSDGLYVIEFNDPQPTITDSTILIGLINEGFILKVDSFSLASNTYTIYTSQGTLEDITISGVYDVAQVFEIDTNITSKLNSVKKNFR